MAAIDPGTQAPENGAAQPPAGGAETPRPPRTIPSISVPKGGGAVRGMGEKFTVSPATGTGRMTVPLASSPGRSGFGPQLALTYDSGAGNGPFGLGWSVSVPSVARKTDKGLPRYRDAEESDVFVFSGAEDLVPVTDPARVPASPRTVNGVEYEIVAYRPRVEGAFSRIERWVEVASGISHWRSISRDNVTTLYGFDGDSVIADPADDRRIFSYLICRSFDDKGNVTVYEYSREDARGVDLGVAHEAEREAAARETQRYLKRIKYGNSTPYLPDWAAGANPTPLPDDWHFEVVFDYGDHDPDAPTPQPDRAWPTRPDSFSSHRSGFEVRTYRRCERVLRFHHFDGEPGVGLDCLVGSTDLEYADERDPVDPRDPVYSILRSATQAGYRRDADGYRRAAMPQVELAYSEPRISAEVHALDRDSVANLPMGLTGDYQLVDLDGEGAAGILSATEGGWTYKRNLSPLNDVRMPDGTRRPRARFGPLEPVPSLPSPSDLAGGLQLMDLEGDGRMDAVALSGAVRGFFERTDAGGWEELRQFESLPELDWSEPNLRFADVTGDGRGDAIVTDDGELSVYPSLGELGFAAAEVVRSPWDERAGPHVVFADGTLTIFSADMSGDGLTDLVRVRSGEVCYWPSLGNGRFGSRVTMDGSPRFTDEEQFDPRRIRLADVDGTGPADLLYAGADGVSVWFNRGGNEWAAPRLLDVFPTAEPDAVQVVDLLGTGTACLVWSSPLPAYAGAPLLYVDLMSAGKPYLLTGARNNLGAETRVRFAPSTRFYLADREARRPWATRLHFPVHVVERVEVLDWIGRTRLVTRYVYHHGYFDPEEREFRGFAMVEEIDSEEHRDDNEFPEVEAANWDAGLWSPPMLTRTWFHTGAFDERAVSRRHAGEYWIEPALQPPARAAEREAMRPGDSVIDDDLDPWEVRDAYRALKGMTLRTETYGDDGSVRAGNPYVVTESSYRVRLLQRAGARHPAVFLVDPRETVTFNYERSADDPRVSHELTLEVDDYGNVLRKMSVCYPRRATTPPPEPGLDARFRGMLAYDQGRLHVSAALQRYTHPLDDPIARPDTFRVPLPSETVVAEVTGLVPAGARPGITNLFRWSEIEAGWASAWAPGREIPYEEVPRADVDGSGTLPATPTLRVVERTRTLYRRDDFNGMLALHSLQSLALPGVIYRLALTSSFVSRVLGARVTGATLQEGGYVQLPGSGDWWIPGERLFYSAGDADSPATELATARDHFFLARRSVDAFGAVTRVAYDGHDLLAVGTTDAVGNQTAALNDYRVLQPALVTDPNGNRTAVAFDALGMVAGIAAMGKPGEGLGDTLAGFDPDPDEATVLAHLADPLANPAALLADASARTAHDLFAYRRTRDDPQPAPPAVYSLAREIHVSDDPGGQTGYRHLFTFSDGFGREIQRKAQAEPGPVTRGEPAVTPRWIGSGWTIFGNKGHAVRTYEPFFSTTHGFEFARQVGVAATVLYDPVGRVVATLHPDDTWEKVVHEGWRQVNWDRGDTVAVTDPRTDPDVGPYFRRLLGETPGAFTSWRARRIGGAFGDSPERRLAEQDAAVKSTAYAGTPSVVHLDPCGRRCANVVDAGSGRRYPARTALDAEGKILAGFDGCGRRLLEHCVREPVGAAGFRYLAGYDVAGNLVFRNGMDDGERRSLGNVAGKPMRAWDARGQAFRILYDALQRPTHRYVARAGAAEALLERTVYGEGRAGRNLCGRVFRVYDSSGLSVNERYDFKGNLRESRRRLGRDHRGPPDWSALAALTDVGDLDAAAAPLLSQVEDFTTTTAYDALDRPVQVVAPAAAGGRPSVLQPSYGEGDLLDGVAAWVRRPAAPSDVLDPATADVPAVTGIDYDARGQRTEIRFGSGAVTTCSYDPLTFRLTRLRTTRPAMFPADQRVVQDLAYTYDAAGNVTSVRDDADTQNVVFFRNQRVEPSADYAYDALYRLTSATGREHLGQTGGALAAPQQPGADDGPRTGLVHPHDGNAMGRYTETYEYDPVGNIEAVVHQAAFGSWTRRYAYEAPSRIDPAENGNRLTATSLPGDPAAGPYSARYDHDAHGNMERMPHLPVLAWDETDRLQASSRQVVGAGTPETTYYSYDGDGQRLRKATDRQAPAAVAATRHSQRLYLGPLEIYREYAADGTTVTLERETLHVAAVDSRVAMVETRTVGSDPAPAQLVRYQHANHLGSAVLELEGSAAILSYEEYYPYGSTSFQAVRSQTDVPKRYRHTGKERDEETGLCCHGPRQYAPWLGRWTSCDPAGLADGENLYAYARGSPTRLADPTGKASGDPVDPDLVFEFEGEQTKIEVIERQNWKKAWKQGLDATMSEAVTFDVDEPNAVGERGISKAKAYRRATSAANRQALLSTTNRVGKGTRVELPVGRAKGGPPKAPISVTEDAAALFTRRFSEVTELNDLFEEAKRTLSGRRDLTPVELKNRINTEFRRLIREGSSDAAVKVRGAFEEIGWDSQTLRPRVATAGKWLERIGKGAAVLGSLIGGIQVGLGVNQIIEGKTALGAVDIAEGGANLGLTIGTTYAVTKGGLVAEAGVAAGGLGIAAGVAAGASVALAAETARAAIKGEETPIEIADKYYGTGFSDIYAWQKRSTVARAVFAVTTLGLSEAWYALNKSVE